MADPFIRGKRGAPGPLLIVGQAMRWWVTALQAGKPTPSRPLRCKTHANRRPSPSAKGWRGEGVLLASQSIYTIY